MSWPQFVSAAVMIGLAIYVTTIPIRALEFL